LPGVSFGDGQASNNKLVFSICIETSILLLLLASCCLDLLEPQFADLGPDALELRAEGLSCGIWLHSRPEDLMGRINQVLNIEMP
jgi:hypothetical protein